MYVTTLKFEQVLNRFRGLPDYDFMLLFVSSFDNEDKAIIKEIINNAERIDRITGEDICFFYFVEKAPDEMNDKIVRWLHDIRMLGRRSLYGTGVKVTMETADDICKYFGIMRSYLPAFILVDKYDLEHPQVFSIRDYDDLESFLTPINILHSYLLDKDSLKDQYKRTEKNVEDLHNEIDQLRKIATERLNFSLHSQAGERLVDHLDTSGGYANAIKTIWDQVRNKRIRKSRLLEKIRYEIYEHGFDIFISCKSQDYALAHDVYDFLKAYGYKPFLANSSLKEVGVDQYTAVIGNVINVCQTMIVFATDVAYLETPYVSAEWHAFVNDINTGKKPTAKLINIVSPDIDIHCLPAWLRDKQCFTIDNYKENLLSFLRRKEKESEPQLIEEMPCIPIAYKQESKKTYLPNISTNRYHGESIDMSPQASIPCGEATRRNFLGRVLGSIGRLILNIFEKTYDQVYSSIFAPAEIKPKSHMIVQVFLHLLEETEKVKQLATEVQKDTVRRDYIPLECKLKKGDKLDVLFSIYGEKMLFSEKKRIIWRGFFSKCSFDYFVPQNIDVAELSCIAVLAVNGIPIGEMKFITNITEVPQSLNPEIIARKFSNIFISYSHKDESKVKYLAEGFKISGKNYFFDRHYLKAGDIFPQKIQDFIGMADLFILCWSKNASHSEYVARELSQALQRAYPKVTPAKDAKLLIYPISINPKADLPENMKETYNFIEI